MPGRVDPMKDAFSSWDNVLPVGTKVQITYSNGKHRDGTILEHRPDGLLKLATNPNRTLGSIYYANPVHIAEIEVLGD
jgi:hypothetical protein